MSNSVSLIFHSLKYKINYFHFILTGKKNYINKIYMVAGGIPSHVMNRVNVGWMNITFQLIIWSKVSPSQFCVIYIIIVDICLRYEKLNLNNKLEFSLEINKHGSFFEE